MRILFVKLGSIGDIIHTLPALVAVRQQMPDADVSWVVERRSAEILRDNPMIDRLIEVDTRSMRGGMAIEEILLDIGKQVRGLREHKYDIAIDFQGLLKSAAIAKLSGAPRRWGFARSGLREPASRFLLNKTVETKPRIHVIRKNLALATVALGLAEPDELSFPIATAAEHRLEADEIAARAGQRFAVLNPAGGWVTKLWHAEKFGQLADRLQVELGLRSIIATGPQEVQLADSVAAAASHDVVLAQPSLKGFYELVKRAQVYVGGDTGPTHLAVAARAPVVGLFGPTEWWRNGSPREEDICVESVDISCRIDCHRRTCSNWICMDFGVDAVFEAVKQRVMTTRRAAVSEPSIS